MKRDTILLCLAIVLGWVAFVRAQSPRQGQAPRTQPQTAAAMTAFTGCVERGATPTEFVLTVTEVPSSAGAAGTAGTSTLGQRIHLAGEAGVGAHTGHKVRITGIVVPQGTPPARGGRPAHEMRVNVRTVTMIAERCTPASPVGTGGTVSEPRDAPQR